MKIDKDNKVFKTAAYKKDRSRFYIIEMNFNSPNLTLYSDEKCYVICRGAKEFPTWIWTADDISEEKMTEIADTLTEVYLTDLPKFKMTAKKEFYEFLHRKHYPYLNAEDYFEMGTLECRQLKKPKTCDGAIGKPSITELDILAKYWYADALEMNNVDPISMEEAYSDMEKKILSDSFLVWHNSAKKIVCMADYRITGNQAKLGCVYTPKEERGKGYAANLIHDITKLLLDKGLTPLLYTDYHYIASNTAYKNAGYEDIGILINFSCSKNREE